MNKGTIIKTLIGHIHQNTKKQVVIYATGVGSQCVGWLFSVGGSSATMLEVSIPYSTVASELLVHPTPVTKFVSSETAVLLAKKAYERALLLNSYNKYSNVTTYVQNTLNSVVGVSCTGTIATNRQKSGEHRAHVGVYHRSGYRTYDIVLEKGLRDRDGEEELVSMIILRAIAEQCLSQPGDYTGDFDNLLNGILSSSETIRNNIDITFDSVLDHYFLSGTDKVGFYSPALDTEISQIDASSLLGANSGVIKLVFPGSFNPLHQGHVKLIQSACSLLQTQNPSSKIIPIFELSIDNVDKPSLPEEELRKRLQQFRSESNVQKLTSDNSFIYDDMIIAVTRAPLFLQKAKLLPGSTFVIGIDTAMRLIDTKYYNDSVLEMIQALVQFKTLNCRFLVAGRLNQKDPSDKTFLTLKDMDLTQITGFADLFAEVPEFRLDISSSEVRQQNNVQ